MMALELPPDDAAPPANLADDEARLMRMAQDDPALFAPVYERCFERVYAYCLRRTGEAQEAEDLCSRSSRRRSSGCAAARPRPGAGGVRPQVGAPQTTPATVTHLAGTALPANVDPLSLTATSIITQASQAAPTPMLAPSETLTVAPSDITVPLSLQSDASLSLDGGAQTITFNTKQNPVLTFSGQAGESVTLNVRLPEGAPRIGVQFMRLEIVRGSRILDVITRASADGEPVGAQLSTTVTLPADGEVTVRVDAQALEFEIARR